MTRNKPVIWIEKKVENFLHAGWTRQISLRELRKIALCPSHKKIAPLKGPFSSRVSVAMGKMTMGFVVRRLVMEDARASNGRCDNGEGEEGRENIGK
jgi:hypothetical protein